MKKGLLHLLLLAVFMPIALHAQVRVTNFSPSMISGSMPVIYDTVVHCDSYTWRDGVNYTNSTNSVAYILKDIHDQDSVVYVLNLTIKQSKKIFDTVRTCRSYVWPVNNQTYNTTGDYSETFVAQNGCDSIRNLRLEISNILKGYDTIIQCEPITWIDGVTYSNDTTDVNDTISSVGGCDSVVYLTYYAAVPVEKTFYTCKTSINFDGHYFYAGKHLYRKTVVDACDTLFVLNVNASIEYIPMHVYETALRQYVWNNDTISADSIKIDTIFTRRVTPSPTKKTCDTMYYHHITILPVFTIDTANCRIEANKNHIGYYWPKYDRNYKIWLKTTGDTTYICKGADGLDSCCMEFHYVDMYSDTTFIESAVACGRYTWIDGNIYTESQRNIVYNMTNVNGCDSVIVLRQLTINANPVFYIDGNFSIKPGESATLYPVTTENLTYRWSNDATTDTITVSPTENTEYSLTATNANRCSITTSVTVVVSEEGINSANMSNVRVYPNPAKSQVIIEGENISNVKIYNMLGQLVVSKDANSAKMVIPVEDYNNGSYILRVESKDGKTTVRSLIIKK